MVEFQAPCISAATPTMISTALPKDALSRPESVWPSFIDICSVASPSSCVRRISRHTRPIRLVSATHLGKGHDSDEAERESQRRVPVEVVRDEAQGHEDEQHIDPRAEPEVLVRLEPARFTLGFEERDGASGEGAGLGVEAVAVGGAALEERGAV